MTCSGLEAEFRPEHAALVVCRRRFDAELRGLAEKAFGVWPRGDDGHSGARKAQDDPARVVIVDKPGSPRHKYWWRSSASHAHRPTSAPSRS